MWSARSARPATPSPRGRDLPPLAEGDLVALSGAGAYGAVMSSTYNSRLLVPEVLVAGGRFAVIRARPSYDEMLAWTRSPIGSIRRPSGARSEAPHDRAPDIARLLAARARLRLARAALVWERVWPAAVAGAVRRSAFSPWWRCSIVLPLLPGAAHAGVLAAFAIAFAAAVALGVAPARSRGRTAIAARRRIEESSGLPHRPLQALADRPSAPLDAAARAVVGGASAADGGGGAAAAGRLAGRRAGAAATLGGARGAGDPPGGRRDRRRRRLARPRRAGLRAGLRQRRRRRSRRASTCG